VKKRIKNVVTLPIGFQDASSELDSRLRLLSELLSSVSDRDSLLDVEMVQELGSELRRYLRSRNALEVCIGRFALYDDNDFLDEVRAYRKRFKGLND